MDIATKLNVWKHGVLGVGLDIDGAYGKQCVDVVLSWAQTLFPGVHYSVLFPPVTSAKDLKGNSSFFEWVANNHADVNQWPPAGAIAVFAAAPEAGYTSTYANPDGHTGVVDHADPTFIWLIQQDGSNPKTVTTLVPRAWRYTRCLGWWVAKTVQPAAPAPVTIPAPATQGVGDARIGKTLYLHAVPQWSVYRVGQQPIRAQRIGYLIPANYHNGPGGKPGLSYPIIGVSQYPNTVTIHTDSYGSVDIYVDQDGEIL